MVKAAGRNKNRSEQIRSSREFKELINKVRAKYILEGKKLPRTADITRKIALKIKEKYGDAFLDELINLR